MTPNSTPDPVNRRDFARTLAAATAATAATTLQANADDKKPKQTDKPEPKPEPKRATKPDPEPPPPAALLLETIRQRYPDKRLEDQDVLQGIYTDLRSDLARSRRLSSFPLENADEPGFLFAADPPGP
jgi:hypothetical protein